MRIAISGSHGSGKSTLIAAFLARRPEYRSEPEAYETLADDIGMSGDEGGPTPEGLQELLQHTIAVVSGYGPDDDVMVERSPVDYVAYAVASRRAWSAPVVAAFLDVQVPKVQAAIRHLDLIALVPVSPAIEGRPYEHAGFRRRVDERLRRALIDDEYELLAGPDAPRVVELPAAPARQLSELLRLAGNAPAMRARP